MSKKFSLYLLFLFLLIVQSFVDNVSAQSGYPVKGMGTFKPPFDVKFSEMVTPGAEHILLNLIQTDLTEPTWQVALEMTIGNSELTLKTNSNFAPKPITISPGSNIIKGEDLRQYFNFNNLTIVGGNKENIYRTDALPEGLYTFTFVVKDFNRPDKPISEPIKFVALLKKNAPPRPILPKDQSTVILNPNSTLIFSWQEEARIAEIIDYEFTLIEVPEGTVPNAAINSARTPLVDKYRINQTSLLYDFTRFRPLEYGKVYAWRVKALDPTGKYSFENDGYSIVSTFSIDRLYIDKITVNLSSPENNTNFDLSSPKYASAFNEVFTWTSDPYFDKNKFKYNHAKIRIIEYKKDADKSLENQMKENYILIEEEVGNNYKAMDLKIKLEPYKLYAWQVTYYKNNQKLLEDNLINSSMEVMEEIGKSDISIFSTIPKSMNSQDITLHQPFDKEAISSNQSTYEDKDHINFSWEKLKIKPPYGEISYTLKIYKGLHTTFSDVTTQMPIYENNNSKLIEGVSKDISLLYKSSTLGFIPFEDGKYSWGVIAKWDGKVIGKSPLFSFEQNYLSTRPIVIEFGEDWYEAASSKYIPFNPEQKGAFLEISQPLFKEGRNYTIVFAKMLGSNTKEEVALKDPNAIRISFKRDVSSDNRVRKFIPKDLLESGYIYVIQVIDENGTKSNYQYFRAFPASDITLTYPTHNYSIQDRFTSFEWKGIPGIDIEYEVSISRKTTSVLSYFSKSNYVLRTRSNAQMQRLDEGHYEWEVKGILKNRYGRTIIELRSEKRGFEIKPRETFVANDGYTPFPEEMEVSLSFIKPVMGPRMTAKYDVKVVEITTDKKLITNQDFDRSPNIVYAASDIQFSEQEGELFFSLPDAKNRLRYSGNTKYYFKLTANFRDGTKSTSSVAKFFTIDLGESFKTEAGLVNIKESNSTSEDGSTSFSGSGILYTRLGDDGKIIEVPVDFNGVTLDNEANLITGSITKEFTEEQIMNTSIGRFQYTKLYIDKDGGQVTGTPYFHPINKVGFTFDTINGETKVYHLSESKKGIYDCFINIDNGFNLHFPLDSLAHYQILQGSKVDILPLKEGFFLRDNSDIKVKLNFPSFMKDANNLEIAISLQDYTFNVASGKKCLFSPEISESVTFSSSSNDFLKTKLNSFIIDFTDFNTIKSDNYGIVLNNIDKPNLKISPDNNTLKVKEAEELTISKNGINFTCNVELDTLNEHSRDELHGFNMKLSSFNVKMVDGEFTNSHLFSSVYIPQLGYLLDGVRISLDNAGNPTASFTTDKELKIPFENNYSNVNLDFNIKDLQFDEGKIYVNTDIYFRSELNTLNFMGINRLTFWGDGSVGYDGVANQEIPLPEGLNNARYLCYDIDVEKISFYAIKELSDVYYEFRIESRFQYSFLNIALSNFAINITSPPLSIDNRIPAANILINRPATKNQAPEIPPLTPIPIQGLIALSQDDEEYKFNDDTILKVSPPTMSMDNPIISAVFGTEMKQDETYGCAIKVGPISLGEDIIRKVMTKSKGTDMNRKDIGSKVSGTSIAGQILLSRSDNHTNFWFFEIEALFEDHGIKIGTNEIISFKGRIFHHMSYVANMENENEDVSEDLSYVPDKNIFAGAYIGLGIRDLATKGIYFKAEGGAEMTFTDGFSPYKLRFDAFANYINYGEMAGQILGGKAKKKKKNEIMVKNQGIVNANEARIEELRKKNIYNKDRRDHFLQEKNRNIKSVQDYHDELRKNEKEIKKLEDANSGLLKNPDFTAAVGVMGEGGGRMAGRKAVDQFAKMDCALKGELNAEIFLEDFAISASGLVETDKRLMCGGGDAEFKIDHGNHDFLLRLGSRETPIKIYPCLIGTGPGGWLKAEKLKTTDKLTLDAGALFYFSPSIGTGTIGLALVDVYAQTGINLELAFGAEMEISDSEGFSLNALHAASTASIYIKYGYKGCCCWGGCDWNHYNQHATITLNADAYFNPNRWTASASYILEVWGLSRSVTLSASGNNFDVFD